MKYVYFLLFSLSVHIGLAQCGAGLHLTQTGTGCQYDTLSVSGLTNGSTIVWTFNGVPIDTVYPTLHAQVPGTYVAGFGYGNATNMIYYPGKLYVDSAGNLYVPDVNSNRILKFPARCTEASYGVVVAGGNLAGNAANQLNQPNAVFVDRAGYLYVSDRANNRIQKFPPNSTPATSGMTIAGTGLADTAAADLNYPASIFVDTAFNVYVADQSNHRVQKFPPNSVSGTAGITVAGDSFATGGSSATQLHTPTGVWVDNAGSLYVSDLNNYRIQKFPAGSQRGTAGITVAGGQGSGIAANQIAPYQLYIDSAGFLYAADISHNRVQRFPPGTTAGTNGVTVAGDAGGAYGSGPTVLNSALGCYMDRSMNLYVADYNNNRIQRFPPGSVASTAAVTAVGSNGRNKSATNEFSYPDGMVLDPQGNIFICDNQFNRVQKYPANSFSGVTPVSFAGDSTGVAGVGLNQLNNPKKCFLDKYGYLYVADYGNNRVLKFPPNSTSGTMGVCIAGSAGGSYGSASTLLSGPNGIAVDDSGYVYVADEGNRRVQKFPPNSTAGTAGVTVADTTIGPARFDPTGIFRDKSGNLFVIDYSNYNIVKFPANSHSHTVPTIVAGDGSSYPNTLGNYAFVQPNGVFVDKYGFIYGSNLGNRQLLRFPPNSHENTIATDVYLHTGYQELGPEDISGPAAVYVDSNETVYLADLLTNVVTKHTQTVSFDSVLYAPGLGTYRAIVTYLNGCIDTSNVAVNGQSSVQVSGVASQPCANAAYVFTATVTNPGPGATYQWKKNGINVGTNALTYTDPQVANHDTVWLVVSSAACGSTGQYTSNLLVINIPAIQTSLQASGCASAGYPFHGRLLTSSGVYRDTLTSVTGCDSTVILQLTLSASVYDTIVNHICLGDSFYYHNTFWHSGFVQSDTTHNVSGCDSIVTHQLIIMLPIQTSLQASGCASAGYLFHGHLLTSSGMYIDTLTSLAGCDSLVTLQLTLTTSGYDTVVSYICQGDSFYYDNASWHSGFILSDTTYNVYGCDSIITRQQLIVIPLPGLFIADTLQDVCAGGTATFISTAPSYQSGFWTDSVYSFYAYGDTFQVTVTGPADYLFIASDSTGYCSSVQGVHVDADSIPQASLCLVTIDSALSQVNVIWEQTTRYQIDSYFIYRAITPDSIYTLIAGVSRDSFSEYADVSAQPDMMSYRYKIQAKDRCGVMSPLSDYHQTIYLQSVGAGNLQWSPYVVDNDPNPIGGYDLYIDAQANGNWQLLTSVAGTVTTAGDPDFALHPTALYRVIVTLPNPCTPGRSIVTEASNIVAQSSTGILPAVPLAYVKLIPNPANNICNVVFDQSMADEVIVTMYDALNRELKEYIATGAKQISLDIAGFASGLYYVRVSYHDARKDLKLIKY